MNRLWNFWRNTVWPQYFAHELKCLQPENRAKECWALAPWRITQNNCSVVIQHRVFIIYIWPWFVFRDHFVTSFGSVISSSLPWAKTNLSVWYSPHRNPNVLISSVLIHMLTHRAVLPAATFPESWGEKNGELRGGKVRQTWTGVVSLLQAHLLWMSCPVHDIFMEGEKRDKKVGHYFYFFFFFFEPLNKPLNYIRPLSLYQT